VSQDSRENCQNGYENVDIPTPESAIDESRAAKNQSI